MWNLTSAVNALFRLQGANGTLSSLSASLVAPNGTTISMDGPAVGWVNWTTSTGRGGHDDMRAFVEAPNDGLWTLQVEGYLDVPTPLWGDVFLDSTLRLEERFEPEGITGEEMVLEVALLNATVTTPGASVEGNVYDPTLNQTFELAFHDDGTGPDVTAADGVYTANYLPLAPGEHQYRITAEAGTALRTADGVLPVLVHDSLSGRPCLLLGSEALTDSTMDEEEPDAQPLISCSQQTTGAS